MRPHAAAQRPRLLVLANADADFAVRICGNTTCTSLIGKSKRDDFKKLIANIMSMGAVDFLKLIMIRIMRESCPIRFGQSRLGCFAYEFAPEDKTFTPSAVYAAARSGGKASQVEHQAYSSACYNRSHARKATGRFLAQVHFFAGGSLCGPANLH